MPAVLGLKTARRVLLLFVMLPVIGAFALMQLVPYRVDNPPILQEPSWDSPQTRELAKAACFDCHSNETRTSWYEDIAPLSWWITSHVNSGRGALNFSECTETGRGSADEAVEVLREGSMPPGYYTWFGLHSEARLTALETQQLADGLRATLDGWTCGEGD